MERSSSSSSSSFFAYCVRTRTPTLHRLCVCEYKGTTRVRGTYAEQNGRAWDRVRRISCSFPSQGLQIFFEHKIGEMLKCLVYKHTMRLTESEWNVERA